MYVGAAWFNLAGSSSRRAGVIDCVTFLKVRSAMAGTDVDDLGAAAQEQAEDEPASRRAT